MRHGGEQLDLHPSLLSSVTLPGNCCALPNPNCTLWAHWHTFPPVLPMLMTHSTISMVVHSLIYVYIASNGISIWFLLTVNSLRFCCNMHYLISCRAKGTNRSPFQQLQCSMLMLKSRRCIDCCRIFFAEANYLRRNDQFVYDPVRNQCLCVTRWYSAEDSEFTSLKFSESLLGFFPPQEQLENEGFSCLMLTFILQYKLWLLIDGSDSHVFILSIF